MITVKQFAEERGITVQAVHQQMSRKKNKEKLVGHVEVVDGIKYLDDEAVQILDESRHKTSVVVMKEDQNDRIKQLEEEVKALLIKTATQADRISELCSEKLEDAKKIALADVNALLLEEKKEEISELKNQLENIKLEKEVEKKELENAKKELADAKKELEKFKKGFLGYYRKRDI